jgi:hypothetical protein
VQGVGATLALNFPQRFEAAGFSIDKSPPGAHLAAGSAAARQGFALILAKAGIY